MMHFMPLFPKNCLQLVVRFSSNTPKMVDLRQVTTAEIIIRKNCAPDKVKRTTVVAIVVICQYKQSNNHNGSKRQAKRYIRGYRR